MKKGSNITSPICINVFWDNTNEKLRKLGDTIYSFFLRNPKNPLDRYLNIPVYLYPNIPAISELQLENAECSANIFLIDDKMVLSNAWEKFVDSLKSELLSYERNKHRIYPVAISETSRHFHKILGGINYIRFYEIEKERQEIYLLINLSNSIFRLLYDSEGNTGLGQRATNHLSIKLFLSHAKKDGKIIAQQLREHIDRIPSLESFMDAHDIGNGDVFYEELESKILQSVLLVIHTDEYSSREWCRKEILYAKKHNCPVIVLNQFENGELRSFPYIGNVPHINTPNIKVEFSNPLLLDLIILEAIREGLKLRYNHLSIEILSKAFNKEVGKILSYPPELLTLTTLKEHKDKIIIYPDPPIGKEELAILNEFNHNLNFITPTLLPLLSEDRQSVYSMKSIKIAISLSETDGARDAYLQNRSIQNLMVELSKYLLISGATLIYSGNINYKTDENKFNFSELLKDTVQTYRASFRGTPFETIKPIDNFSFYPIYDLLEDHQKATLKDLINFIPVPPPENLKVEKKHAAAIKKRNSFDKKYVWAKSLTAMRNEMMQSANAVIVLGGKFTKFASKIPGVLEEVVLALKQNNPIFLIGAFGGITKAVIEALSGQQPTKLSLDFYLENDEHYDFFVKKFNSYSLTTSDEVIDYEAIVRFLNSTGQKSNYGLNNGLTSEENQRLFYTKNELEIISLILKGLKNITSS